MTIFSGWEHQEAGLLVEVTAAYVQGDMWLWDEEHHTVWPVSLAYPTGDGQVEIELTAGEGRVLLGPELLRRNPTDPVLVAASDDAVRYLLEVEVIVMGFEYEYCHSCGRDLDQHVIAPGPFGLPIAWCQGG